MINITPALETAEWRRFSTTRQAELPNGMGVCRTDERGLLLLAYGKSFEVPHESLPALIALANDSLHAEDPRRFTRDHVERLRATNDPPLLQLASAIEAYLAR
jgi:hypothetical protein